MRAKRRALSADSQARARMRVAQFFAQGGRASRESGFSV
jgi:hypothetical protein